MGDEDISDSDLLQLPVLYENGRENKSFGWIFFLGWVANGILQSLVIFYFGMYSGINLGSDGRDGGLYIGGIAVYACLVFVMTAQVTLITASWNTTNWIVTVFGPIIFFPFLCIYSALNVYFPDAYYLAFVLFKSPAFWLVLPCAVVSSIVPYVFFRALEASFFPTLSYQFQVLRSQQEQQLSRTVSTTAADPADLKAYEDIVIQNLEVRFFLIY
jgi:magnesium-transporting ATPase (P-type)